MTTFIKPLEIKEIKKNFRNKLKNKKKDDFPDFLYFPKHLFYYYIRGFFIDNKKEFYEMKSQFTSLKYQSKNNCLEIHNKILTEILKYQSKNNYLELDDFIYFYNKPQIDQIMFELKFNKWKNKSFDNDLMSYYYDHFNYPNYLKTLQDIEKTEIYYLIYSFEFLNEKELRNILFQFYI
jgi:hypothetical protein